MLIHLKTSVTIVRAMLLVAVIGIAGCAQKPDQDFSENFKWGTGTHILELPTLGEELEDAFANREKKWVSHIHIHGAPAKDQLLWTSKALMRYRTGLLSFDYTHHKASYYLSEDMTAELKHVLGLYYHISPNSDVEVDARLSVSQSGEHENVLFAGKFMDVSSKFSLRLTESVGRKTTSDKIFTGLEKNHLSLSLRRTMFPRKFEAENLLEKAYRKMWRDLLNAKEN